jgi:Ca-activated chloride channel family protein
MQSNVKLSTRFLTAQGAHQVRMLVSVTGEAPATRPPINLALVLDRSGSMSGRPLEEAKRAAVRFAGFLGADDRLAVVVFDDRVQTIFGPEPADGEAARLAIQQVHSGNTTNLSGGWLEGRSHVQSGLVDGTNRVVLLTDGQANVGITEPGRLAGLARGAQSERVSTTCIGFGPGFNEDLLRAMSDGGGGNFWYIESEDQMTPVFDEEIEGLVSLAAQNLKVTVRLADPRVQGVTFVQDYPLERTADGSWVTSVGDLYGSAGRALGLVFHVEHVSELGQVQLGAVEVSADVVTAEGVEHRVLTMPVIANLDAEDHVEPEVERTLVKFEAAKARREAVDRADGGDFDGAAATLRQAAAQLMPFAAAPDVKDEVDDLEAEAQRMEEHDYDRALDRKYHMARGVAARDMKAMYMEKIARHKPRRPRKD